MPFETALGLAQDGDQVYCDPPYVPLSATASFTGYAGGGFNLDDQALLANSARQAGQRGACVVLTNHDLPIVREELYPSASGFDYVATPKVARSISRRGATRGRVPELMRRARSASVEVLTS